MTHVIREKEQGNSHRDKRNSNDEKGRQDSSSGQNRLPAGKPIIRKTIKIDTQNHRKENSPLLLEIGIWRE
jgi:hypothetical protein